MDCEAASGPIGLRAFQCLAVGGDLGAGGGNAREVAVQIVLQIQFHRPDLRQHLLHGHFQIRKHRRHFLAAAGMGEMALGVELAIGALVGGEIEQLGRRQLVKGRATGVDVGP